MVGLLFSLFVCRCYNHYGYYPRYHYGFRYGHGYHPHHRFHFRFRH